MYAILNDRGRQHKVSTGDLLQLDKRQEEVGATITFDNILLVGGEGGSVKVGSPNVAGRNGDRRSRRTHQRRKRRSRIIAFAPTAWAAAAVTARNTPW